MDNFGLPISPLYEKYTFNGNSQSDGASWHTWVKPLGKSRITMILIGAGGGGGSGVIGANSTAAGGGGGGSGGMTIIEMPLDWLPPRLYISVGQAKTGAGAKTYVATQPFITTLNHVVGIANAGAAGGNASGATAGAAGGAAAIAANSSMPLGWAFAKLALAGQAGIIGGTTVTAGNLTLPTTGLRMTGGTGGGGLPAAAATGTSGGNITGIASPSLLQGLIGGAGSATATNPAANGVHGYNIPELGPFFYGGTGAASTHGTATGGGLVQGSGGNGAIGSGGGGMGGALTGSAAGTLSQGGAGLVLFYCY